jgi:hypothetical protein
MPDGHRKRPPVEALVDLGRHLAVLPVRDPLRKQAVAEAVAFFGISAASLYRCLHEQLRPISVRRADYGEPRAVGLAEMERYAEIIAALNSPLTKSPFVDSV